ncbi:YigZ family protein [Cuneatibacter sp. NSJ-177]|uniref:YigZ family protein n=1 Tax=Cuneatibacter sp. NSJ-177 TaxID=2931401 RepID=UPI001FD13B90|nr:YigZ family protein [Cuneatibacter sp. NSJ-177]MCJ7835426.1 YigZ family protein [Cuneatibacter sp. NSJ-177]
MAVKILYAGGVGEIVEKKSRFIAETAPVRSEDEAMAFLEAIRKKYWDTRHHCSAFVIGEKNPVTRCSDDGEPSGTAGRPILDVLLGEGICNACVVVTRYFGGTLLGTGGLVRAYGQAAKAGLAESIVLEKHPGVEMKFVCDYSGIGKIQYIAGSMGLTETGSEYTDVAELSYMVPAEQAGELRAKVTEATAGRTRIEELRKADFAFYEKELLIL